MAPKERPLKLRREHLEILKQLARLGGEHGPVLTSSRDLGTSLGLRQQSADRYLIELAEEGMVARVLDARKQRLSLTPKGRDALRREYAELRRIFDGPGRIELRGTVSSGLGEGGYYLSQPGYMSQFETRLGYRPFSGTLNVRLAAPELARSEAIREWGGIRIEGFSAGGRTFGGATCFPARINRRRCHLVVPDRTHHTDVVEFIAREKLRDVLHLKDGDLVQLGIEEV